MDRPRVFLLSPANAGGERAALLFNERARFTLATRLRTREGAPLGEVFSFVSGLYFRGKLTYARRFAAPYGGERGGVWVITTTRGLVSPDAPTTLAMLRRFAAVELDSAEPRYRRPLARSARDLRDAGVDVVLLGSIATGKYVDVLLDVLGERLLFPSDFVGRGDMSRGALLLRSAREGRELSYMPVAGAVRRGRRAPRVGRAS